jgi:hypothetical protein
MGIMQPCRYALRLSVGHQFPFSRKLKNLAEAR